MSKPIVAIVGRPNVGKSTLFNQIGKRRVSIVDDMPGVTRDRIYMEAEWLNHNFTMIDTGGIEFEDTDHILKSMRQQALVAMEEADVIVFVVDGRSGLTTADEEVGRMLRNTKKPVIVAVNKIDSPQLEAAIYEFYSLGLGDPIGIAASNSIGLGDLLDAVVAAFPENTGEDKDEDEISIAVIGRPNVGKSSIVNALIGENRVIVSDVAGTTRDAIDTHFVTDGIKFMLIDTAGMRRRGKIDEAIERYSVMRSLRAVDRADVVLMVINAEDGITEQDKKIAAMIMENHKGCVLLVNKWDLAGKMPQQRYRDALLKALFFMNYMPVVFASAKSGFNIRKSVEAIDYVAAQVSTVLPTGVLNRVLHDAFQKVQPPIVKNHRLKLYYATQVGSKPIRLRLFVNDPKNVAQAYEIFLLNTLRGAFGLEGAPVVMTYRSSHKEK